MKDSRHVRGAYRGSSGGRPRRGFSLVELLVVITIILVLMALAVPLVGKVRSAAATADARALINSLRASIEQYYQTFGAYPGPLSDEQMYGLAGAPPLPPGIVGQVTQAENMLLGLLGGLAVQGGQVVYDPSLVGQGPRNLSLSGVNSNRQYKPFLEDWRKHVHPNFLAPSPPPSGPPAYNGRFSWVFRPSGGAAVELTTDDSNVPELLDGFGERMAVLYLRARRGARGIMSDASTGELYQYDLRQISGYTVDPNPAVPPQPSPISGVSEPLTMYIHNNYQGLWTLGPLVNPAPPPPARPPYAGSSPSFSQNPALMYFNNPSIPPADLSSDAAANATGTPRAKDTFILISAGADRIYGTIDDVASFGSVLP